MNLQHMIELAILDAMALLDEGERDAFEKAFQAAPPAIQAQIRREQTRLSQIESLLPDVMAPAGLRAAVIDAVRRQVEAARSEPVAGFISPEMMTSKRVSPLWRTGAMAMAAAAVVLGITTMRFVSELKTLNSRLQNDGFIAELSNKYGGAYVRDVLFNHDTKRVMLASANPSFKGQASLFVSPEWKEARLFYNGFKTSEGRTYKLAIVDDKDQVVNVIATINPEDGLQAVAVALDAKMRGHVAILAADQSGKDAVVGRGELPGTL